MPQPYAAKHNAWIHRQMLAVPFGARMIAEFDCQAVLRVIPNRPTNLLVESAQVLEYAGAYGLSHILWDNNIDI